MAIPLFPALPGLSWPVKRSPVWKTLTQESLSGKETRVPVYTFPRYRWTVSFEFLRTAASYLELQTLLGFFNSLNGGALPFYYSDTNDGAVSLQPFGIGDGVTTAFQLVRSFGGFVEPVQSVNPAGLVIRVNGVITAASFISSSGVVSFASAPAAAAAITWSGTFFWLCRMDADTQEFAEFVSGMFSSADLSFTSIKL
jgi:uncharacterized protein (TIGR02217 family)